MIAAPSDPRINPTLEHCLYCGGPLRVVTGQDHRAEPEIVVMAAECPHCKVVFLLDLIEVEA